MKLAVLFVLLAYTGVAIKSFAFDPEVAAQNFLNSFYRSPTPLGPSHPGSYFKRNESDQDANFDRQGQEFWKFAEMIELVEDMYDRSVGNSTEQEFYKTRIDLLMKGFYLVFDTDWLWNDWNDDIVWMVLASVRAAKITGNWTYRDIGKQNFDAMYNRAIDTDAVSGTALLWMNNGDTKNTCVNGPAIIAALEIFQQTQNISYYTIAKHLYSWLNRNMVAPDVPGMIYDHFDITTGSIDKRTFTYNAGVYVGSAIRLHEMQDANRAINYVMANLTNGASPQLEGILHTEYDPIQDNDADAAGFIGVFSRYACQYVQASKRVDVFEWLTFNANTAWRFRNRRGLEWADFHQGPGQQMLLSAWETTSLQVLTQCLPLSQL